MASGSELTHLACFSRYLNCFNSDFDPWVVVGKGIWCFSQWSWFQPFPIVGQNLSHWGPRESTRGQTWLKLVKIDENLRIVQVWCRNMKSVFLGWFWLYLTLGQPMVDQGHFGQFDLKRHYKLPQVYLDVSMALWRNVNVFEIFGA